MFYLGMEKYQNEPPLPDAAPVLGRELKALDFIFSKMVDEGINTVTKFDRDLLPEEEGKGKKEKDASAKPGSPNAKSDKSGKNSVSYHSVQLELVAEQVRFRNFLNALAAEKSQFFVPRLVVIKNEKPDAPSRVLAGPANLGSPQNGAAAVEDKGEKLVFGAEKLTISLVLDIVDFAEAAAK